jgi:hypothetical protein
VRRVALLLVSIACWFGVHPSARADGNGARSGVLLDRAVVRFLAPEMGGPRAPRFVFERVLAFEARLEALADADRTAEADPYRERYVRAALERHIAEELLSSLRIEPEPTATELVRQSQMARVMLAERVGGVAALERAASAEGIQEREVLRMLRRQARASLYLDRMVAPMLAPSDAELLNLYRTATTPFRALPYEEAKMGLRRWYVQRRLSAALSSFYENARSRLQIIVLE